jgi:hypothetical protein
MKLRKPPRQYMLDRLLIPDLDPRNGKARAGFETFDQVLPEDLGRALGLRAIAAGLGKRAWGASAPDPAELARLNLDTWAAADLAARLEAAVQSRCPEATPSSAFYMRDQRLRIGAALWETAETSPYQPVNVFTAIHPSWLCPADHLLSLNLCKVQNQFRTHLNRAGVITASGFIAACLHGEFEPFGERYQLHFHGLCAGDKVKALNRLRGRQGYIRTAEVNWPLKLYPLNNPPRQLSYLMQSFWPMKAQMLRPDGTYYRTRTKTRIKEPYHSLYLLWLDKWSIDDMWLLSGIRTTGGRMILT